MKLQNTPGLSRGIEIFIETNGRFVIGSQVQSGEHQYDSSCVLTQGR